MFMGDEAGIFVFNGPTELRIDNVTFSLEAISKGDNSVKFKLKHGRI